MASPVNTIHDGLTFLDKVNAESGPDRIRVRNRVAPYRGPYWECTRLDGPRGPQTEIWSEGDILDRIADRLFIGDFPTGIIYADRGVERDGDYKRLAFLPYGTLLLKVEADCPTELRARIEADARRMAMLRGQDWPVSTSGQTVRLGSAVIGPTPTAKPVQR